MRRVTFRVLAVAALLLVVATPAAADTGTDAQPWPQLVAWFNARIGIPNGPATATRDSISLEEWLILMARIGIPN